MPRRKYSDREKALCLLELQANDGSLTKTSEITGIPLPTIASWRDGSSITEEITELCSEKAPDLAAKWDLLANKLVDRAEGFIDSDKTTLGMVATAAGIATDKARLLRGESTSNTRTEYVEVPGARTAKILDMTERLRKVS